MRTEAEMMNLILGVARQDERIRAVAMNGSRTNPNAPKDIFQDYDIVYIVTDVASFTADHAWVDVFGELMIMQLPDEMTAVPSEPTNRFAYLMQFADGNRIDMTLVPVEEAEAYSSEDKLTMVLLDKDGCFPLLPAPSDEEYWVKRPTAKAFADCCNEFWWVAPYVAKGLWRREILYAHEHLDRYVKDMLIMMLSWQVGIQTDFTVSVGKCGKYLEQYLAPELWRALLATYADGSYEDVWRALFATCDLFRTTATNAAAHFGYEYPHDDDQRVSAYLRRVRELPADAADMD